MTVISTSITDRCTARFPLRKASTGFSAPRTGRPRPDAWGQPLGLQALDLIPCQVTHAGQVRAEVLPRVAARAVSGPMDCTVHQ